MATLSSSEVSHPNPGEGETDPSFVTKRTTIRVVAYSLLVPVIVGVGSNTVGSANVEKVAKLVSIFGHLLAVVMYYRVKSYVDNSYTSYTKGNDFGYSNIEKAQFRAENKRIARVLMARGFMGWALYAFLANHMSLPSSSSRPYVSLPIWITSLMGYETMVENFIYRTCFWSPNAKKVPKGNIPRSTSGRLI